MRKIIVTMFLLVMLAACAGGGKKGEKVDLGTPFAGGTAGLVADFVDFRSEVFDGGRDPFDVVVRLENKGEATVKPERVRVKLSGINPAEFGKLEEDLKKSPADELFAVRKDPQGNVVPGGQTTVEFVGLNHFSPIAGARVTLPLRADICYTYTTQAASKLCVRENLLAPEAGGICEINEDKEVKNSGAPVQIGSLRESARGKDRISFSFEVTNIGSGDLFERGSACDRSTRAKENRVYVIVNSRMAGLQCTGLTTTGTTAEGFVTLYEKKKIVTCTQTISSPADYEQQISIDAVYDYEEYKQTQITVKSSGETAETG
ncbi:MAG: hypothetical protein QXM31_01985 [Candidatus Woesearchaeota archaeon]